MQDKNDWITQKTKTSCKHKRNLNAFNKNSRDPKEKAHCIKHGKILRKLIKQAKKEHYIRLTAKPNNKIKTGNVIKTPTGNVHSVEQVPTLFVNDEKLKDPTNLANAFNNFSVTIMEN